MITMITSASFAQWCRCWLKRPLSVSQLLGRWPGIRVTLLIILLIGMGQPAVARSHRLPPSQLSTGSMPASTYIAQASDSSDSLDELQQQQKQIEAEQKRVQQEQERLQNLEQSAQDRLEGLQQTIRSTSVQINDNEYRLELATQRLKQLQEDLLKAEQTYATMQRSTVARLQFLQRQQTAQGWAVLLQSQNLNEFLNRRRQLKLVYQADQELLVELDQTAQQIQQQRLVVAQQKNEISLIVQQLQEQKQQYEAQAQTQDELVGRLKVDRQALEAAAAQLERDSQGLTQLIQQKIAEQEAARRAASRNQVIVRGTGRFSYPMSVPITSGFGSRMHPILGYRRFHAGIDFGASHGSTIRSADSGVVIFSGWYGGYGRSVIIDHGDGLTTLYAHASAAYVKEGESVQRGQAIAAVGSTGLSTGPHLHFEVRKHGEPTNPMNYL